MLFRSNLNPAQGTAGSTNTGGGGGGSGGGNASSPGAAGGSGVAIIRYPISVANAVTTGIYSSDATYRYFKFNTTGTITF